MTVFMRVIYVTIIFLSFLVMPEKRRSSSGDSSGGRQQDTPASPTPSHTKTFKALYEYTYIFNNLNI